MTGNVPAVGVPTPLATNPLDQSLACIGFSMKCNRNSIRNEGGMKAFANLVILTKSNIQDMASGFSERTTTQGHINFGMRRVKYTLKIMHWAQYESRCSIKA